MKNIYLIPTDKPSRLFLNKVNKKLLLDDILNPNLKKVLPSGSYQHIYITLTDLSECKLVILTTDQDLIKDGVQAIDDEFLQWYVKNPSCEYVKTDLVPVNEFGSEITVNSYGFDKFKYKIIIPKEPKPIHQQIIDIVGGEDRFREIANLKPKQETLKKVEENIDREEWIHFFKNNSKEEILEYLIKYKFPL
jgi:hypothetical protein